MSELPDLSGTPGGAQIIQQIVSNDRLHLNVEQTLIVTTEDKIHICLTKHLHKAERRRQWIAPLGVIASLVATLVATDFNQFIFSPDTWNAIFVISIFFVHWMADLQSEIRQGPE